MKKSSIVACALGAALICAAPVSVQWSPEKTLSGFFKKGPPILLRVFGGLFLSEKLARNTELSTASQCCSRFMGFRSEGHAPLQ